MHRILRSSLAIALTSLLATGCSSYESLPSATEAPAKAGYVVLPVSVAVVGSAASAATALVTADSPGFAPEVSAGKCSAGSCSIDVWAAPAQTTLFIALESASGGVIDTGSAPVEADDDANDPPAFCFGCTPVAVSLSADPASLPAGSPATTSISAVAYDAAGRWILGTAPFPNPIVLMSNDPSATLARTLLATPSQIVSVAYSGANVPAFAIAGTLPGAVVTPVNVDVESATPIELAGGERFGDAILPTEEELAAIPTAPPPPVSTDTLASFRRTQDANGVDYRSVFPPVASQGRTNTCTVFSGVYAIYSALQKAKEASNAAWLLAGDGLWGNNPQTTFSPRYTYNQKSVNGGRDNGSMLIWVLESLKTVGAIPLAAVPWSETDSPATSYLTQANLAESSNYRISAYYRVTGLQAIKDYLAAGYPIYMGMDVDRGLTDVTSANPIYSAYAGGVKGGHAMVFVGYDDTVAGGSFIVMNSWGATSARDGFFYLPFRFWTNGATGTQAMVMLP